MRGCSSMVCLVMTAMIGTCSADEPAEQGSGKSIPDPATAGRYEVRLESGGYERVALVHVPRGYDPAKPPALVVLFHGGGGDPARSLEQDGWSKKADEEGFVVVAPRGLPARPRQPADFKTNPQVWNSGQLLRISPRSRIDDVAYVGALLDDLAKRVPHDRKRIFVTGHSNGAAMTFRLAAELPDRFRAIAPVAGMLAIDNPRPKHPIPTLYIIGTLDKLQPVEGGEVTTPWGTRTNPPISRSLETWARAIGCEVEPKTLGDTPDLRTVEYPSKSNGPTLRALYIPGHGHHWPGAKRALPDSVMGPHTLKLDATDVVWKFFESQAAEPSKPSAESTSGR
ncbi:MAG: alpha/beta hydrolase-fold protein [Isosphaeraceae bacterium]|nr:alpha/beta hydrolase-fold protein [Isosphaeraceae bacterium]